MTFFIPRPQVAEQARKIVEVLKGVNDEISDAALAAAIGSTIKPGASAMRIALRELEKATAPILFRRIRKTGWKRMSDHDLVEHSEVDLKKIARGARRGRKRLNHVRYEALSTGDQLHAARNNTRFNAIEDAAATVKVRRTASNIPDVKSVLDQIKAAG